MYSRIHVHIRCMGNMTFVYVLDVGNNILKSQGSRISVEVAHFCSKMGYPYVMKVTK